MNKAIIAIVIVAVILAGGYFIFRSAPQSTPSVPQPSSEQTTSQAPVSELPSSELTSQPSAGQTLATEEKIVIYTDSGYSPATLTVKKGETVTWKNQSSQSMWTASGKHPTHLLYPTTGGCLGSTFDACQGIQPGGSWSFKFDIVGNWKYHNHLNSGNFGAIVVE